MSSSLDLEIYSARVLHAPPGLVYKAFAEPRHLANWWGPEGFTNTIHAFDLRPGGIWKLTMHGPDKGNYENESVFTVVEPGILVLWTRRSQPHFDMEIRFDAVSDTETRFSFRMIFATPEACEKVKPFVLPKNEENFDRLERELEQLRQQQ